MRKMGIVKTSGITAFDIAALDAVDRAQPFGPAPGAIVSPDGNVYLHWEFHRDEVFACSTQGARPFILNTPGRPRKRRSRPPPSPASPAQGAGGAAVEPERRARGLAASVARHSALANDPPAGCAERGSGAMTTADVVRGSPRG